MKHTSWTIGVALTLATTAAPAFSEDQPFVFTVTTTPSTAPHGRWAAHYDAGYGERAADLFGGDGLEQRVTVQGALGGGFTVLGQAGFDMASGQTTRATEQVELLKDIVASESGLRIAGGLGMRREYQGTNVLLGRLAVGRAFSGSSLFSNVRFERPFATGRDRLDVVTSLGWLAHVTPAVHVGVEGVGEDLEGLWEGDEAEGGAKVFVGPTIHVAPRSRPWSVSLCGGPILYASHSSRESLASRSLVSGRTNNGYTVRVSLGYSF
jgi:hypothetical protein